VYWGESINDLYLNAPLKAVTNELPSYSSWYFNTCFDILFIQVNRCIFCDVGVANLGRL